MITDFERYGFAAQRRPQEALWIPTVDFEAFGLETIDVWEAAMRRWAQQSAQRGWRFAFFVSLEDLAALHSASPAAYERLLGAIRVLHASGSRFFPHNHWAVDLEHGGDRRAGRDEPPIAGYRKRPSMFYDVVYRRGIAPREWLATLREAFGRLLTAAGLDWPEPLAFRAGGWDHGSSAQDVAAYVDALSAAGFQIDSSASSGQYGTASWRIGAPFGENVFELAPGLLEVAPCWSLNRVPALTSPRSLLAVGRLLGQRRLWSPRRRGALVTVQHFDHLFHDNRRGGAGYFAIRDPGAVRTRVDAVFDRLAAGRALLRMPNALFSDLSLE